MSDAVPFSGAWGGGKSSIQFTTSYIVTKTAGVSAHGRCEQLAQSNPI